MLSKDRLSSILGSSLFYGVFITIIEGVNSSAVRSEVIEYFHGWIGIVAYFGERMGYHADMIRSGIDLGSAWFFLILWFLLALALIAALLVAHLFLIVILKEDCDNEVTAFVVLIALALVVFLVDYLTALPINLLLLFHLLLFAYGGICFFLAWDNEEGKQAFLKTIGLIILEIAIVIGRFWFIGKLLSM